MPVFRVEKNSNYTTMCNYHLRDQGLSLKGKGLLSMLLSLPDTWNYSVRGLFSITPDGVDGVLTALKELERLGYLERNQQRESNGRMGRAEYVIYEMSRKKPCSESPCTEKPYLLLKEEQTAAYSVEIWKRFRKWGGIPTGITQNVKDLLSSREVTNIFENSDFIYMLNQAAGDRQILADQLNISPHQLSYVTHSGEGEGLLFYGNVILPFVDRFPTDLELYRIMTTKLTEVQEAKEA